MPKLLRACLLASIAALAAASAAAAAQPGPAAAAGTGADETASVTPPSPLDRMPADRGAGRFRILGWIGWSASSGRKDTVLLQGDDISWEEDLDAQSLFVAPRAVAELKVRKNFYAFIEFSWMKQKSRASAPSGGIAFDGVSFDQGTRISASLTRFFADFGFLAWGAMEEDYAVAFAAGARFQSVTAVLSSDSQEAVETTDSVFPFLEARAEYSLSKGVVFEASARVSLFTITDRSTDHYENSYVRYVDGAGNTVGEVLYSSSHRYYTRTQVNGLLELAAGVSASISKEAGFYFGGRFTFTSARRFYPDRQENADWIGAGLEMGLDLRF